MLNEIRMPDGGQNTDQLRVVAWRKQVGDPVNRGEILLEVDTDKAVLEIESFAKGVLLERTVEEGGYAKVGEVIAYIGCPEDAAELRRRKASEKAPGTELPSRGPAAVTSTASTAAGPRVAPAAPAALKATPAAKKAARELGINLSGVQTKKVLHRADVLALAGSASSGSAPTDATPLLAEPASDLLPLSPMRRTIAAKMQLSAATIPAFSLDIEADMTGCMELRTELNQADEPSVAYHDFIGRAIALAAREFPHVNAAFSGDGIRVFRSVNLGLAVAVEQGLVAPVVQNAESKSLREIARENAEHVAQVRTGRFDPRILEGATLTLSNLGRYPITRFTAIINPPQACIIAVGRIGERAIWKTGDWRALPMVSLTASFDHRVLDGGYGAAFLARLKEFLENPKLLL